MPTLTEIQAENKRMNQMLNDDPTLRRNEEFQKKRQILGTQLVELVKEQEKVNR